MIQYRYTWSAYSNINFRGTSGSHGMRTKIIIRPEALIPDFDLVTGEQAK